MHLEYSCPCNSHLRAMVHYVGLAQEGDETHLDSLPPTYAVCTATIVGRLHHMTEASKTEPNPLYPELSTACCETEPRRPNCKEEKTTSPFTSTRLLLQQDVERLKVQPSFPALQQNHQPDEAEHELNSQSRTRHHQLLS